MEKAKKYEILYRIFAIIGLLGIIDLVTRSAVEQNHGLADTGYISIGIFFLFQFLFGTDIAITFTSFIAVIIFGLSIIWLVIAYFLKKKSKFIKNPSEENKKGLSLAKFLTLIVGILALTIFLTTMFIAISG